MKKKLKFADSLLAEISRKAQTLGIPAYLVGGAVRDKILGKKTLDLDIVCLGNPSRLVKNLARKWRAEVKSHPKFRTYVMTLKNGRHVDFATARKETYRLPGQLPLVKPGTLKDDILRRDFTINSLAISLNKRDFGELVDLAGGLKDLEKKQLRVLHPKSFRDDPTRILRLARFASRGLKIGPETEAMVSRAKNNLNRVSAERVSREIIEILDEPRPSLAMKNLKRWGLFETIFPGTKFSRVLEKIDKAKTLDKRFLILMSGMNKLQAKIFMEKFRLTRELKRSIINNRKKEEPLALNGYDLIKMGYKPGPLFKKIFEALERRHFSSRKKAEKYVFDNFTQKI